jgi:general secretion pathway protein L
LYIRHPSKASVESAHAMLPCPFALVSSSGAIERQGALELAAMSQLFEGAKKVVLLLAASDVTLLRVKVPPLTGARLKAALPNLVEDQLVSDPFECVMVAGIQGADGLRQVAVAERAWLEQLVKKMQELGAGHIALLPAQLCLPTPASGVVAAIGETTEDVAAALDLTLRFNPEHGIGLPILTGESDSAEHVIATLRALVPEGAIELAVPADHVAQYQALNAPEITVQADGWGRWIGAAHHAGPNLAHGLAAGGAAGFDWQRWRWALILLGLLILIHALALNYDWLRNKNEADKLRNGMVQGYRTAFPKDPLSTDLMAQVRQKIAAAKISSGQAGANDFATLVAGFGDAWNTLGQGRKLAGIAGLEYKEKALLVRFKKDGDLPQADLQQALDARSLSLKAVGDGWEIKSK